MNEKEKLSSWRLRLYEIIFESDTPQGKLFDLLLLVSILLSVMAVMLESVTEIKENFGAWLLRTEWFFTLVFTIEYIARFAVVQNKRKYIFSFFGIIDLLSILPAYLSIFFVGVQSLLVIRTIRLLRIFRILKLVNFLGASDTLKSALNSSRHKIAVFLVTVATSVIISGTVMYLVEGNENGFSSIPRSIYWAIVTMTTVGYGDIAPQTVLGQAIASFIMIMGYGIIAVPTGIVSAEMIQQKSKERVSNQCCPNCLKEGHDTDAIHCKFCGSDLN